LVNPLVSFRERLGLSRAKMAIVLRTSYSQVTAVEGGHHRDFPTAWRPVLVDMGEDFDKMSSDYLAWRQEVARELVS
jgi:hypothetical protein